MSGAVWGRAASSLEGFVGAAGEGGQQAGLRAERDTAVLLDSLSERGWVVFHSVRVRGGAADIDHVLVGSRGVVLIDSKAWRPGTYVTLLGRCWRRVRGSVLFHRFVAGESTSLERSVAQMRLAGVPVVAAAVAVWPSRPGRVGVRLLRYPGALRVRSARRAVRLAARWAGPGGADPRVVASVSRWVRRNERRAGG